LFFSNNGHFGNINDSYPPSYYNSNPEKFETSEIADGAAIKIIQSNSDVPINSEIKNSIFLNNRGRSGGAVNINISQSQNVNFNNVNFLYNSVVCPYVNSSALFVFLRNTSTILELSSCIFWYNYDGRNTIGYIVADKPSNVLINNCSFVANKEYDVGLIELNMQSHSNVNLMDSHFYDNIGNALLYVQLRSSHVTVSYYTVCMLLTIQNHLL